MNTEGSVLNHTGDIDGHREHKKHASYADNTRNRTPCVGTYTPKEDSSSQKEGCTCGHTRVNEDRY